MSDEEEYTDEEVEEEEVEESEPVAEKPAEPEPAAEEEEEEEADAAEPEEAAAAPAAAKSSEIEEVPKLRKVERHQPREGDGEGQPLTEAEQAMLDAKRRHEEEEAARLRSYEENRKLEKIKVDEELAQLKQRQVERRREWEQEERQYADQRRADEERKRAEIDARKAKIEEAKTKREEEKQKRQLVMAGAFVGGAAGSAPGRNFTVQKKEDGQKAGSGSEGQKRKGKTAEEIASEKANYMSIVNRPVDVSNLLPNDLKAKIKQLHAKIVRLESEKYDLSKRHERQDYDLKELAERESQRARNKALAMGVEIEQAESGHVRPPKINVSSKFDRQVDRRSYKERYDQFEAPYVKPNPSIARGTARPPPEWGRKVNDELDQLRKNLEPPKYVEQVKIEGARAPVQPIPLQLPASDFEEAASAPPPQEEAPAPPEKPKRAGRA